MFASSFVPQWKLLIPDRSKNFISQFDLIAAWRTVKKSLIMKTLLSSLLRFAKPTYNLHLDNNNRETKIIPEKNRAEVFLGKPLLRFFCFECQTTMFPQKNRAEVLGKPLLRYFFLDISYQCLQALINNRISKWSLLFFC